MAWLRKFLAGQELDLAAEQYNSEGEAGPDGEETAQRRPEIWAVGGGKGGVGKSLITSNFGILLTKLDKKVLLVDADFGAANLHTFIGDIWGTRTLSSFLKDEVKDISEVTSTTPIRNLEIISGAKDSLDAADFKRNKVRRLQEAIRSLDYDYVLIDTGPGTSANLLDIFMTAHNGVLVMTPEPTAIENTYRFLKCLYLRKIKQFMETQKSGKLRTLLQQVFNDKTQVRTRTISDILNQLRELDIEEWNRVDSEIKTTSISLVMNQTSRPEDEDIGHSMVRGCYDYFGVNVNFLGNIFYDYLVRDSIRTRQPLAVGKYNCEPPPLLAIEMCLNKLLDATEAHYKTQPIK